VVAISNRRSIGNVLAMLTFVGPGVFPHSTLASVLRYLGIAYITLDLVLRAREGYLRRRPHWTRESWHGYLKLCLIPAGAFLVLAAMMTALELRLPIVGASRSTPRILWAIGTVVFLLVFAVGLVMVIERLSDGEPSRQFEWPGWLGGRRA
jgi:hypothetical protein